MVSEPVTSSSGRKPLRASVVIIAVLVGLCLIALVAGGVFGFQAYATYNSNGTATSVMVTRTNDANLALAAATSTQGAQATGTAVVRATNLANVFNTNTAAAGTRQAQVAQTTATANSVIAGADVPPGWRLSTYETFSDSYSVLWDGEDSDRLGDFISRKQDGVYAITGKSKMGVISWRTVGDKSFSDFYLSIDAKIASGDESTLYGIVFRASITSGDEFYEYSVSNRGNFALLRNRNGLWRRLAYGHSPNIVANAVNNIAVRAIGSTFRLYTNHTELKDVTDDALKFGAAGPMIDMPYGGAEHEA